MLIAFDLIGVGVVLTTVLPLVRRGYWWIRIWDFPRAQIAAIGLFTLAALVLIGSFDAFQGWLVAALALAVAYQLYRIWPFTPLAPLQVLPSERPDAERKLRLLVANVLVQNRDSAKLLALIQDTAPDLVLTLEPDAFWANELAALDAEFPFSLKYPQDNAYGMMLFSRLRFEDAEIRFVMDEDVPSFRLRVQLRSGDRVWLYAVHPRPPHTFQASFDRDAELLVLGREIHRSPEPTIIAGDLNDVAWSYTTRMFQPDQRPDGPAPRARPVQYLQRPQPADALAARPHLLRPRVPPGPPRAAAGDRLGPLPDPGRAELRAGRRRRAGGAHEDAGRSRRGPAHDPRGATTLGRTACAGQRRA